MAETDTARFPWTKRGMRHEAGTLHAVAAELEEQARRLRERAWTLQARANGKASA